ncbi:TylF/MycF/NovP-related O-methyltransferase [Taibaiella koreensis]|uniref:TylF/MycF/NovP-related O-methyltransferase n=1 Tax=Taibaiella koreensis TaxID=1268548 RepID=UPI001969658A|nr:TylF/MycF/NovP-related O-methyltransferase [Taibaiella koreensis]
MNKYIGSYRWKQVRSAIGFAGIRLFNMPFKGWAKVSGSTYQVVIPASTYAPWLKDKSFSRMFRKVKPNSLINQYQAWELWLLAGNMEMIPGDILEVGVWRGSTSIIMGTRLRIIGSSKKIYACDTFEGVVKASGPQDNFYKGGEHKDTSMGMVSGLIRDAGLDNICLLRGIFPDDTGDEIAGKQFALCHIDVDAYQSARSVLEWVWPRLQVGGMVVFSDYGFPITRGITHLVNEYYQAPDRTIVHNLNGNGIMIKIK